MLSLFAVATLTARADQSFRCRTLPAFAAGDTNVSEQIEEDLLGGVWIHETEVAGTEDRIQVMLQFAAEGKVDFLRREGRGDFITECLLWGMEVRNGAPLLWMTGSDGRQRYYRVEPTCYGIDLIDMHTAERLVLKHNAQAQAGELSRLRQSLSGSWSNAMYPFDLHAGKNNKPLAGAFLKYEFRPDGTLVKIFGGAQVEVREGGTWEVSKDGRYLLMHSVEQQDGQRKIRTEMARIKYLQLDELVLEHALQVNEAQFCTRKKDFFFNKS